MWLELNDHNENFDVVFFVKVKILHGDREEFKTLFKKKNQRVNSLLNIEGIPLVCITLLIHFSSV